MPKLFLSLLLLMLLSSFTFATSQDPDVLILDGKTYDLYANPLESYYGEGWRPAFWFAPNTVNSGNWRGYVATWEIINDSLYLTKINSWFCNKRIRTRSGCRRVTLRDLFGVKVVNGRVAATWSYDELRVPDGKEIEYVHMGYGSVYERDIIFGVDAGKILKREVIDNTKGTLPSNLELQKRELEKLKNSSLGEKPTVPHENI